MNATSSDWHLGGGGLADDSNRAGLFWVAETALAQPDLTDMTVAGDMAEKQFGVEAILSHNRAFLAWLDARLCERRVPFHVVEGNHDPKGWALALRQIMRTCDFRPEGRVAVIDGWVIVHGCSGPAAETWDVWNGFSSPLKPLADGIIYLAGGLERLHWDVDGGADPRRLVSPAHAQRERFQAAIRDKADEWAEAHPDSRLCYGHTHHWRIAPTRRVVNCGCVVNGHAEVAFLRRDQPPVVARSN